MKIIGLEIGSQNVRAVEFERSLGRFEIQDYHEAAIAEGESTAAAVARLLAGLPNPAERIALCYPSRLLTNRSLTLPTKDKKAIGTAVQFELEDDLPFEIDIAHFDSTVLAQSRSSSEVYVVATLKKHLAEFLTQLSEHGIDPDLVTTESWALRTHLVKSQSKTEIDLPAALLSIHRNHSLLTITHQGRIVLSKILKWSGDDLTQTLATRFSTDYRSAEKLKLDSAALLTEDQFSGATPDGQAISEALSESLKRLTFELKQSLLAAKNKLGQPILRLWVSGGTALIPGLLPGLERESRIPTLLLRGLTGISPSAVSYSDTTDARFAVAGASGVLLAMSDKVAPINLRKGEFKKLFVSGSGFEIQSLRGPIAAASTVFVCFLLSMGMQSHIYSNQLKKLDQQIDVSLRTFFPRLSNKSSLISNPSRLKRDVESKLKTQRDLAALFGVNFHQPLRALKALSLKVDKASTVDLIQFSVGSGADRPFDSTARAKATFTFLVNDDASANLLKPKLKDFFASDFSETKNEPAQALDSSGPKVRFSVSGVLKEESYAR